MTQAATTEQHHQQPMTDDERRALEDQFAGRRPMHLSEGMSESRPAFLGATSRGPRPNTVFLRLDEIESVEYVSSGNKCVVTMRSGRYVTISDERSRPTFEAIRDALAPDAHEVVVPPLPATKADGVRNVGTAREATIAANNNEQMSVRRDLMPPPPGLTANARLGDTAKDSRGRTAS